MTEVAHALDRRTLLLGTGALAMPATAFAGSGRRDTLFIPAQTRWADPPPQRRVQAGLRPVGSGRLFTWDTGGSGEPIVLLHPMTGSHASWPYQQPVLAAAGYRVIGYSRRGFFQSDPLPSDGVSDDAEDLRALLDQLGIERAHIVASAAGGFVAREFVARFPARLRTLTLASTIAVATGSETAAMLNGMLPEGWEKLPAAFRELSPSYRLANPAGTRRWIELEEQARHGPPAARSVSRSRLDPAALPPLLCMTGDADLYAPPALMRAFVRAVPQATLAIFAEAGHALFWEQPEGFNRVLLSFLGRNRAGRSS